MTLKILVSLVHRALQSECFTDVVEQTGLAESTVSRWRKRPPAEPSAKVLKLLCQYLGFSTYFNQLEIA